MYTDEQYHAAMVKIDELIAKNPKKDTPEFKELEELSIKVIEYEQNQFPIKDAERVVSNIDMNQDWLTDKDREFIRGLRRLRPQLNNE